MSGFNKVMLTSKYIQWRRFLFARLMRVLRSMLNCRIITPMIKEFTALAKFNIRLKAKSDETTRQQIANQIASAIADGKFKTGDSLPSERGLAEQLGVNRKTIRAAYDLLAERNLIETLSTSGRRVRKAAGKQSTKSASQNTNEGRGKAPKKKNVSGRASTKRASAKKLVLRRR